jgi:hypothetical protein
MKQRDDAYCDRGEDRQYTGSHEHRADSAAAAILTIHPRKSTT